MYPMHVKRNDLNAKSRMKGDFHVRFRERLRVKFPWSTRQELLLLIQHTVEQMPAQRKRIYEMSRKEGKNNDEIAQLLAINKRTVENHLTQALADIRKMLKHFYLF